MTCEEVGCPTCDGSHTLNREQLRNWLNRPPPPKHEPEPEPEDIQPRRELLEAGHG